MSIKTPITAALLTFALTAAAEPPLFIVDTPFDPEPSSIYEVDPVTGSLTLRASLGLEYGPVLGLAAANDTVLYAIGGDEGGCFTCFLYRITLDPSSTTPLEIAPIGPIYDGPALVTGITGMTFRDDGQLWLFDEYTEGLFAVDPATAAATRVATISTDVLGGDITFDREGTLWMWSNAPSDHGLYELDPESGIATLVFLRPDLRFAGIAAIGHSQLLYGSSPASDSVHELHIPGGFTGAQPPLTLAGSVLDHKRGDADSPFCANDAGCADLDACTVDSCSPGGCRHAAVPGCCTSSFACGDGDPCTNDVCVMAGATGTCVHVPQASALGEAAGLTASDKVTFSWEVLPEATSYDALRLGEEDVCFAGLDAPALVDESAPPPGALFRYLVRGSTACGAGTLGAGSDGTPRATPSCP